MRFLGHSTAALSRWFAGLIMVLALAMGASAPVRAAGEPVILTVTGLIGEGRAGGVDFTRADLEALGVTTIETATPWHEGRPKFDGVLLSRLLAKVGATGKTLKVSALNDYAAELPVEDAERYGPILAFRQNGEALTIRSKGPLFVIYPFDRNPELRNEAIYTRSVWQVRRIEVK